MRKKILSVMLTICMVLALMPQMVFAEEGTSSGVYIFFDSSKSTSWEAPFYAYVYDEDTSSTETYSNGEWQGQAMQIDPATGYYYIEVSDSSCIAKDKTTDKITASSYDLAHSSKAYVIISDSKEHKYPNDGARKKLELGGHSKLLSGSDWQSFTPTAEISYELNGGFINSGNVTEYIYGKGAALPTDVIKTGYTFAGWYENNDFSGSPVTRILATDTGNKTFYANWKDTTVPVISGINDGNTYCDAVEFEVSDNVGVARVTANDVELTPDANNKYTLEKGKGTVTVVATDNACNETSVIVTINNGHTAGVDDGNCSTPVYCIYHPNTVVVAAKSHDFRGEWKKDEDGHWHICQNGGCTVAELKASHSGTDDGDCTTAVICECGYIITAANAKHSYGKWQSNGNNTHRHYCTVESCNSYEDGRCTGGDATCTNKAICKFCQNEYGEPDSSNHAIVKIPSQAPTYSEAGYKEYWQCNYCKVYFSDAGCKNVISDLDAWKAGDGKIDKLIPPKTDSVTYDKDGNVSVSIEKSITTNDGVTGVDITDTVSEAILSGLESSESKSVVITAVTRSSVSGPGAAKPGTSIQINLPESAVKKLAEVEGIKITIVTDNGSIVLDKGTLEEIASKSGEGGKVNLVIETVEQTGSLLKLELTLKTSGGEVSDFGSGSVEVTVAISDELKTKNPVCVYIDEQGTYYMIGGRLNDDGTFTFVTGHFSTYAIMPEEEVASVIKVQTAEAEKAAIKNVNTTVSLTTKKIKKGIKVTVKVPASKKADKSGVIIYRSQKKSSGYAVYKKVKTSGASYTVTNTKNLKGKRLTKGRKYYYKARAYKVIDGKTYYGPMSAVKYAKAR